jgi:heme/copper-type cytochrome/quinol oxidase subunit 2
MWFTPKYTTKEMKEKLNDPDFVYEISCDQMCGKGHFTMRGIIEVVTQEEYDLWLIKQNQIMYRCSRKWTHQLNQLLLHMADTRKELLLLKKQKNCVKN